MHFQSICRTRHGTYEHECLRKHEWPTYTNTQHPHTIGCEINRENITTFQADCLTLAIHTTKLHFEICMTKVLTGENCCVIQNTRWLSEALIAVLWEWKLNWGCRVEATMFLAVSQTVWHCWVMRCMPRGFCRSWITRGSTVFSGQCSLCKALFTVFSK